MKLRYLVVLSFFVPLFMFSGCFGNLPKTSKVNGHVTYEGNPLPNVMVSYVSTVGTPTAIGSTNVNGEFVLTTFNLRDGAIPGEYKVSIAPMKPAPTLETASAAEIAAYKPPFPKHYFDADTSGFTVQVEQKVENNHQFNLQK
ncbi:MAG: hypothetical protein LBK82_16230 [Planctomycetaceae bacterium]|jgi:hypothetical protein|nr:hypothetical protein [Planctomycetaceae bacterium]